MMIDTGCTGHFRVDLLELLELFHWQLNLFWHGKVWRKTFHTLWLRHFIPYDFYSSTYCVPLCLPWMNIWVASSFKWWILTGASDLPVVSMSAWGWSRLLHFVCDDVHVAPIVWSPHTCRCTNIEEWMFMASLHLWIFWLFFF
jgi:hypothetical protein